MTDFQVGLPYLRARAQDYYERLGGGRTRDDDTEPEIRAVSRVSRSTFITRLSPGADGPCHACLFPAYGHRADISAETTPVQVLLPICKSSLRCYSHRIRYRIPLQQICGLSTLAPAIGLEDSATRSRG